MQAKSVIHSVCYINWNENWNKNYDETNKIKLDAIWHYKSVFNGCRPVFVINVLLSTDCWIHLVTLLKAKGHFFSIAMQWVWVIILNLIECNETLTKIHILSWYSPENDAHNCPVIGSSSWFSCSMQMNMITL